MRTAFRRILLAAGGLTAAALMGLGAAHALASKRLTRSYETHRIQLPLPADGDREAAARGRHLVHARYGCAGCHGENLAGGTMIDQPAIGVVRGPNLTSGSGSRTANYSMSDWDRSVRHGIKPDGTASLMPAEDYFAMSDAELSDIASYVRSLPAVNAEVPRPSFGPVGNVLLALGKLPLSAEHQQSNAKHPAEPPAVADNREFGAHLAATCTGCHRPNLAGGRLPFGPPDWPAAANLTSHASGLGSWSFEDFDRAITQGVSKDGRALKEPMAGVVAGTKQMLPTERRAIWTYLRSVQPATNEG